MVTMTANTMSGWIIPFVTWVKVKVLTWIPGISTLLWQTLLVAPQTSFTLATLARVSILPYLP